MFGLFKKKKEDTAPAQTPVPEQDAAPASQDAAQAARREFLARFPEKETDLVGITAPGGIASKPVEGTDLFHSQWRNEPTEAHLSKFR